MNADALVAIKYRIVDAMWQLGNRVVTDTKTSLSIPGPEHSPPGEPPHTQTGALMEGIECDVEIGDDEVTLTVSSSRTGDGSSNIPADLEFGHNLVTKTHTPPRRVPKAVFHALAPLGGIAGVSPTGVSLGTAVERPYMRPQMDLLASRGLGEIAEYMQGSSGGAAEGASVAD
jgi:hypothetical protein